VREVRMLRETLSVPGRTGSEIKMPPVCGRRPEGTSIVDEPHDTPELSTERASTLQPAIAKHIQRVRSDAGSSKHSSRAPFAQEFRTWWDRGGHTWHTQKEMSRALGIRAASLCAYFGGRSFPPKEHCATLFKATGLECFGSRMVGERVLHVQFRQLRSAWSRNLLIDLHAAINSHTHSPRTREGLRASTFTILRACKNANFTLRNQITPHWLQTLPAVSDARRINWAKGFIARFLLTEAIWTEEEWHNFNQAMRSVSMLAPRPPVATHAPKPPAETGRLLHALAYNCGLSTGEILRLTVSDICHAGLAISTGRSPGQDSRLLTFGSDWEQLPAALLGAYREALKPDHFLFYKLHPRDERMSMSRATVAAAIHATDGNNSNVTALRLAHFREDFRQARDLRELRFHLRNVHGLGNPYAGRLIKRLNATRATVPIPIPYLIAALCVSRLLRGAPRIREGGKRAWHTWENVAGYKVSVDWPAAFAREASHRGIAEGLFRSAVRSAHELCGASGLRPHAIHSAPRKRGRIGSGGRAEPRIENWLALTRVEVRDRASGASWSGAMFELHNRGRRFTVPLLEAMIAGQWRPRCEICAHPQRCEIERRIAHSSTASGRVKGWKSLAKEFSVSYWSILGHAGLRTGCRPHLAPSAPAPAANCPSDLAKQISKVDGDALVVYVFLLAQRTSSLSISRGDLNDQFGVTVTQTALSLALNALLQADLISEFNHPSADEFSVTLTHKP